MLLRTLVIAFSILSITGLGQTPDPIPVDYDELDDEVLTFISVEFLPVYPGCENEDDEDVKFQCFQTKIQEHIIQNFTITRKMQKEPGGKVWVEFIIEKDGSISSTEVSRSSGNKLVDAEALRIVSSLPAMTPAIGENNTPVRMRYTVPINANWTND